MHKIRRKKMSANYFKMPAHPLYVRIKGKFDIQVKYFDMIDYTVCFEDTRKVYIFLSNLCLRYRLQALTSQREKLQFQDIF